MKAGYSTNPLFKKLGIKEGHRCLIINEPENYVDLLEEIPSNTVFLDSPDGEPFDFIHVFVTTIDPLRDHWNEWKSALKKDGMLWISWPKQSSALAKTLNGEDVRAFGLAGGLVDTKVCAVDHDWSGLKFMYRKTDR